jgi:hypothetical protein
MWDGGRLVGSVAEINAPVARRVPQKYCGSISILTIWKLFSAGAF